MTKAGQVVFAVMALTASAAHAGCKLGDLQWMAGTWRSQDGDNLVEERWTGLPSGQLMGSSWSVHTTRPGGVAEAETVVQEGGAILLRLRHFDPALAHAREDKDAPMTFVASLCEAGHVVFDGQGDKTGEHIAYRRDGERYTFIGDFLPKGQPLHVEQTFTRVQ